MPTQPDNKTETIKARVEPELVEAVFELRDQNPGLNTSETVRLLIRKGILATHRENSQVIVTRPPLPDEHYAIRAETFMECLSDLLVRQASHDPAGAQRLADQITVAFALTTDSLAERVSANV